MPSAVLHLVQFDMVYASVEGIFVSDYGIQYIFVFLHTTYKFSYLLTFYYYIIYLIMCLLTTLLC